MIRVASTVLYASDLEASARFYRLVGLPLEDEHHDEGARHCATELGDVHFAVYQADEGLGAQAPTWRCAASDFLGFYVDSLDDVVDRLRVAGEDLFEEHQQRPWGCRIVARDPDGRAIEINQRGHCPG